MGRKSRYRGGAKYANGNYKAQQKAYNASKYGTQIRVAANKADRESKKNGTGVKGDGLDNSHYPGSKKSRLKPKSWNAGNERRSPRSRLKIRK
jgi:hypothetical protein